MANHLNEDLTNKVVIFMQKFMEVPATEHPFRVKGGFGARPLTNGQALIGEFLSDGAWDRMEGYMVERYATAEEIEAAETRRRTGDGS